MTTNLYLRRCFMFQSRQCLLPQNFTIPRIYVIITNHFLVVHLHFCGSLKKKYVKIKLLTRKQNSFHSSTLTTARDSFFEVLWMSFAILTFHLGEHVNRNLYISNQFGFLKHTHHIVREQSTVHTCISLPMFSRMLLVHCIEPLRFVVNLSLTNRINLRIARVWLPDYCIIATSIDVSRWL